MNLENLEIIKVNNIYDPSIEDKSRKIKLKDLPKNKKYALALKGERNRENIFNLSKKNLINYLKESLYKNPNQEVYYSFYQKPKTIKFNESCPQVQTA